MKVRCQSDINISMENWRLPMTQQTCQSVLSLSWSIERLSGLETVGEAKHMIIISHSATTLDYYSSCILQVAMRLCNFNLYGSPLFDKDLTEQSKLYK